MDDRSQSQAQLLEELEQLRGRVAQMESLASEQAQTIKVLQETRLTLEREVQQRRQAEVNLKQEDSLLRRLLEMNDRDWQLVAYEIHDGLAQQLAGALFRLRNSERLHFQDPRQAHQDFVIGMQLLEESVRETRRLIDGLRPLALDESGIVAAIENLVAQNKDRGGPQIELVDHTGVNRLAPPLEGAVFRIVRESLTNACRHSQSSRVRVMLRCDNAHLRVEVEDWGVGFDPSRVDPGHFGLEGIRERTRLFGGQATIDSAPGNGTRVIVELPLDAPLENTHELACRE